MRVFISWKEAGTAQVASQLSTQSRWLEFVKIAKEADGFVSATPELIGLYLAAGCANGAFVPTPYPLEMEAWNFGVPLAGREGIFVGTREFDSPTRNHLLALCEATRLSEKITVINSDGRAGYRLIKSLSERITIIPGPIPYEDYLRLMASHRIVFQLDVGAVPGQVAGDALLCRMPCVGGNGAIERLAFPSWNGHGRSAQECASLAALLIRDDPAWHAAVKQSQTTAMETVAFEPVAQRLAEVFG
jgi:hypothetical protein